MDIEELREALAARERFAPDPDAVLETVLANPPRKAGKRPHRLYTIIGIAAAVALIAGTVSLVRSSGTHPATAGPQPAAVGTSSAQTSEASSAQTDGTSSAQPVPSALRAKLDGTFWNISTVAKGTAGTSISVNITDRFAVEFKPGGTVLVSVNCQSETVPWTSDDRTISINKLPAQTETCPGDAGTPSAAAVLLAAGRNAMATGQTAGHLDGRSLVLQAGGYQLVFRYGGAYPAGVITPRKESVDIAAQQWADFPLTAKPRPVVLLTSAVIRPLDALPKGADENALDAGRVMLAGGAVPAAPKSRNSYPIITAQTAIDQLTDPQADSTKSFVHITNVQLTDHPFTTDRGETSLPTWKLTLTESRDPIYVLAVAAAGRYPSSLIDDPPVGLPAVVTGAGRDITISFVAHHASTGHCDPTYTSTFDSKETPTVVVMAVTLHFDPAFPQPGCGNEFARATLNMGPGQPDSKTLHLAQPLGDRVLVDLSGTPYFINPR